MRIEDSYDESENVAPEIYYYQISQLDLVNMGLENIKNDDAYIINYSTGEVFNITQRKTATGEFLYIYAK